MNATTNGRIVIAGGSGFLGEVLSRYFRSNGDAVIVLTRHPRNRTDGVREVLWDGKTAGQWERELDGATVLINLAGRSVDCRYTPANRREIMDSRIFPTRILGEALARCPNPPSVWLNASTATIYRHTFGPGWTESGEIGATPEAQDAFSVEVATEWEKAFMATPLPHVRRVALRTAMVLGHGRNSVFPVLRRMTRLGLGGRMGDGRQYVSWIHRVDFCRAIEWLITHKTIEGPVNVAAPQPLTNDDMMRTFRSLLHVPVGLPAHAWMLEIGAFFLRTETELIIKSRRVIPALLQRSGFDFKFTKFEGAVRDLLSPGR